VEGICTANNPFGLGPPPTPLKDQAHVFHPGVNEHLMTITKGRLRGLGLDLSLDQKALIQNGFVEALGIWNEAAYTTEREMWKSLEASRYGIYNQTYGLADVNVTVKLLIPLWLAADSKELEKMCWSVEAIWHHDGTHDVATKFNMRPARDKTGRTISVQTAAPESPKSQSTPVAVVAVTADPDRLKSSAKPSAPVTLNVSAPAFHMPPPAPVVKALAFVTTVTPAPVVKALTTVTPAPAVGGAVRALAGPADPPSPSPSTAAPKTGCHSVLMTAADVTVAKAERAAKQLEIETANVQVCDEIALKIQELNAELKRRRDDVVTVSDGSSESDDSSDDGDWDDAKLLEVRKQILVWHEKQSRTNHSASAPGDSDVDRFKYDLLMKHLKTLYKQPDGSQKKGQIPSDPEQADALLSSVIVNCPACKGLCADRIERKRSWTAAEALTAKSDAEWSQRYHHHLQESEYESDGNHQGDDKCVVCSACHTLAHTKSKNRVFTTVKGPAGKPYI
jgi:hypothetical protein